MVHTADEHGVQGGSGNHAPTAWTPHSYQLRACKHLLANNGAALFLDPGLGKTSITLATIKALKDAKKLKGVLVIAPLRVCHMVWPAEVRKWEGFADLKVTVLHGKDKDDLLKQKSDVYVINPEGLEWLFKTGVWKWDTLVVDESTKFKSWKAQRTKLLKMYLHKFERRWILTGTPAPNGIGDLFSQVYLLDGGRRLGKYITHFRSRFMMQSGFKGYQWVPKVGALEEIEALLKDIALRLEAADWLKLPPLIHNRIEVELPKHARKHYEELEAEFVVQLKSGEISAVSAATLGVKLRQFTNGLVYDDERRVHFVHEAKLDALEDLVEELSGTPVLVAVAFLPEVEAIRKRLGADIPYLGGGVSTKAADEIAKGWNAGKYPIVLAHPSSVAHGLNLQGGRHVCWYGLTWNFEEYDQFIRRVWRQGQTQRVVCHSIVAVDTMDEKVERALREKKNLLESLLQKLK